MKTRILHTKIWKDKFFTELSPKEKLLFLYLITNERVNIIHCYELTDREIFFDTGIDLKAIKKIKDKFENEGKIYFFNDWIYLKNSSRYENYKGEKNEKAKTKIKGEMSDSIKAWFNGIKNTPIDTPINKSIDTPKIGSINHKSEIINHKSEINPEKSFKFLTNIPEDVLSEFTKKFNCAKSQVISKGDDLSSYCQSKGRDKGFYKDYKALLRNAIKKDFGLRPPPKPIPEWQKETKLATPEKRKKVEEIKLNLRKKFNIKN